MLFRAAAFRVLVTAVIALVVFAAADVPARAVAGDAPSGLVVVELEAPTGAGPAASRVGIAQAQDAVLDAIQASDVAVASRFTALPGFAAIVTDDGARRLAADPRVRSITPARTVRTTLAESVRMIHADAVHDGVGITGAGMTVAVVDTGYEAGDADLAGSLAFEECFIVVGAGCPLGGTHVSGPGAAADDNGHGTIVSGVITSNGVLAPRGVAPAAAIGAYKIVSASGSASSVDILNALNDIIANHPEVRAVNISLSDGVNHGVSCDGMDPLLTTAISTLRSANTLVFVASGNQRYNNGITYPSCISDSVATGMVWDDTLPGSITAGGCTEVPQVDVPSCFSNSSAGLDLLAPGGMIVAPALGAGLANQLGTSLASPHAAGAAALLWQLNPALTAAQVETALESTGVLRTDPKSGIITPRIDVWKAARSLVADPDGDGLAGTVDNCPLTNNPSQTNDDRNFYDQSPPYLMSADDATRAYSDELGNVCDPDDDNDSLSDIIETAGPPCASASGATDPVLADSDGDRRLDRAECLLGFDPDNAGNAPPPGVIAPDGDADWLPTSLDPDDGNADIDGDGVRDGMEFRHYNTSILSTNTDADTCGDRREVTSLNNDEVVNSGDQLLLALEMNRIPPPPALVNVDITKDGVLNSGDQLFMAVVLVAGGVCP